MQIKSTLAAITAATIGLISMDTAAHAGSGKKFLKALANGGNGGSFNVVIGNGNVVGNGGNGGSIRCIKAPCRAGKAKANGGRGGDFNIVIGNGNVVGNGGDGGRIRF
jgi:hypothetical protein